MARKSTPPLPSHALEGDLDVFSIHLQWERLLPLLGDARGTLQLDLTAISDLDLSGLQLLCVLEHDLKAKGIPLSILGVKPEWQSRFASLGLGALFGGGPS
ncbi:lipid asymmetry maintenance protein MlaB [Geothrix sp. PMB-07]|uniref:STAS domain-containing protein n=1 Tax=Geothrix sp. PMB-07 TaxID=3068640 RepID=UPI002741FE58|nr:STAS domain-containing protein [Geothrix sp. PMB-07]WLT30325.1 STAS domain-containing protein [Geothrix sp. PMB-07]